MSYADKTYYRNTYIGRACSVDATLEKWLSRASDDLDIYTYNGIDTDELSADQLTALQKACCAQAENYVMNGDEINDTESFSLGSFSIKTSTGGTGAGAGVLCERAERYLSLSSLLFRGVRVSKR